MSARKLRVATIVGTRPEIIRLAYVLPKLILLRSRIDHTGQNFDYELNQIFFDDLALRQPDHYLGAAGGGAAETIGNVIVGVDRILSGLALDAVLVLGDTNRFGDLSDTSRVLRCFTWRPERIRSRESSHVIMSRMSL